MYIYIKVKTPTKDNICHHVAALTAEFHRKKIFIGSHRRKDFLFYRRRPKLNAVENRWAEYVHAGIDLVADVFLRFLYESVDLAVLRTVDNYTIFRRLCHLRDLQE